MPINPYESPKGNGENPDLPFTWKELIVRLALAVVLIVLIESVLLLISVWVPALQGQ